jgi:hypothetical protein
VRISFRRSRRRQRFRFLQGLQEVYSMHHHSQRSQRIHARWGWEVTFL